MLPRLRLLSAGEHFSVWVCALFALVSMTMLVTAPLTAALCLLFFGGGFVFWVFEWRRRAVDETMRTVGVSARRFARHDIAGYQQLIVDVAPLGGRRAADTLTELSECARLLDGLFFHARRREIRAFPEVGDVPLSWALASLNPDGYVRAAALAKMGRAPQPEFIPFLVERAVERVDVVRSAALTVLRPMLADESARTLIARSFSRVAGRRHAGELAALLAPESSRPEPGRCSEAAFASCGTTSQYCVALERGAGPSLAPICCGNDGNLWQPCDLVSRQRRRWAREQSGQHSVREH
ncbi:hypothetical protein [Actinoplanes lobatus]|nr:hypothetical protein [Actinoplanes lobatus]MBB4753098.1 hypothetical protein [Actinoplanes lobatus]